MSNPNYRIPRNLLIVGIVLLAVGIALVAASCGTPNKLTEGKVISKGYDDPDTIDHPPVYHPGTSGYTSCTGGYGNTPRTCRTSPGTPGYWTPGYTSHDGPHWYLKIEGIRGDGEDEAPVETHEVPQWQYDQLNVGDHWKKADS